MSNSAQRLVDELSHETYLVRRNAFDALHLKRTPKVKSALLQVLENTSDKGVCIAVIKLLAGHEGNDVISALLEVIKKNQHGSREAAKALGNFDTKEATEGLCWALQNMPPKVASVAAVSLGKIKNPASIDSLGEALEDGPLTVQVAAASALGAFENERAISFLFQALENSDWKIHAEAFNSLSNMTSLEGIEPFAHTLANMKVRVFKGQQRQQELLTRAQKTRSGKFYLCNEHYLRFGKKQTNGFSYLGCRECGNTAWSVKIEEFFAVLDSTMPELFYEQEDKGYLNWLDHKELVDFDAIAIGPCNEDDIEAFCIQVGNDTDPIRTARYPNATCWVKQGTSLSGKIENNLKQIFGEILYAQEAFLPFNSQNNPKLETRNSKPIT